MSRKKEILNQVSLYTIAAFVTQFITIFGAILTRKFLGPHQMGLWVTIQLVLEYSAYTTCGTATASGREIPYYIGKKNKKKSDEIKNIVATFGFLTSVLTSFIVVAYAFLNKTTLDKPLYWGLIFASVMIILQRINNLQITLVRAYKRFDLASRLMVFSSLFNTLCIVIFAYYYRIYGFLLAMCLSLVFDILYIALHHNFHFKVLLNKNVMSLIHFGLPLMLLGIAGELLRGIDRIVIIKFLGFEAMGFYSIAIMVANLLGKLPRVIDIIMVPHFHEKYGERDNIQDIKGYIDKSITAYSLSMPIIVGSLWIVAPFFVRLFLPLYEPGINAMKYLLPSTYFFSLSLVYGNVIIAAKKHLLMFPILGTIVVITALANISAVWLGWGISGVAVTTTFAFFLHFLFILIVAGKNLYTLQQFFQIMADTIFKSVFMISLPFFLEHFIHAKPRFLEIFLRLILFLLCCLPFALQFETQIGILGHLTDKLRQKYQALRRKN